MRNDSADRPTRAQEEITRQMIEAGIAILAESGLAENDALISPDLLASIYRAMTAASGTRLDRLRSVATGPQMPDGSPSAS